MSGREIIGQLSPGDMLGPQKAQIRAMPLDAELFLGTYVGEIRGLSFRHNPQDDTRPSIALVGPAKFIPADAARSEIWATRSFLPGALHESVVAALMGDKKAPIEKSPGRKEKPIELQLGHVMPLVIEVGVKSKPETAVGYVYMTKASDKVELQLVDPLAALTARAGIKALPAPTQTATVAADTPNKEKARKRK